MFKALSFASEFAGEKAGTWGGRDGIVRVAQCIIPDTEEAEELLQQQLRKFGVNSWLDSEEIKAKGNVTTSGDWEWVCTEYFITVVCSMNSQGQLYNCSTTEIRCISYELSYYETPGGGAGGDPGFPGDDPGDCDPMGIEPCFDDGGSSIPPPEPDPCDVDDPPVYCTNPCNIGDPLIDDNVGIQGIFEGLWELSRTHLPIANRLEQGGFITFNQNSGEYGFTFISDANATKTACGISGNIQAPPNTVAYVHTHPFFEGENTMSVCGSGGVTSHSSTHSQNDYLTLYDFASQIGNPLIVGYVLDGNNIDKFNTTQPPGYGIVKTRCGY